MEQDENENNSNDIVIYNHENDEPLPDIEIEEIKTGFDIRDDLCKIECDKYVDILIKEGYADEVS